MCGRYAVTLPVEAMRQLFRADGSPNLAPRLDIRPTTQVPVIRAGTNGTRQIAQLRWGFVPRFAKAIDTKPLINARAETVADKPTFRDAFAKRRCLVPMDYYYEWQTQGSKMPKQAYAIGRADGTPFAAAGIWEAWAQSDGSVLESLAILTKAAAAEIAHIHDRMPVEIAADDFELWLDPTTTKPALSDLIAKVPQARQARPVDAATFKQPPPQADLFGAID
jgi:putative SOS response-associated peptidase YedK